MSTKKKNALQAFFSSVKLALFLLFTLAATSIIGTIVPQNNPPAFYVQQYGANLARLMQRLGIPDMYSSWWFTGLLFIFSLNLIVCSLERIPNVWRLVSQDNLLTSPDRLKKMGIRKHILLSGSMQQVREQTMSLLTDKGWKPSARDNEGGTLLFAQKGGWTRFGVYIVHTSILIILIGAIIGSPRVAKKIFHAPNFAFKGSIMIPESRSADFIYSFQGGEKIPLGFTVHCDFFTIDFYANGMPKEYLAKLSVLENGKEVLKQVVEVNKPLTYKGITFYQSSYQPYPDFIVEVHNTKTGLGKRDIIPSRKQIFWKEGGARFGIINTESRGKSVVRVKVWFSDNQGAPSTFWIEPGRKAVIKRQAGDFTFKAKQLYATGLQVSKDPGVWFVYTGCGLMLIGLMVAFFMSHRKIWAFISEEGGQVSVLFAGSANKNKLGFEKTFAAIVKQMPENAD